MPETFHERLIIFALAVACASSLGCADDKAPTPPTPTDSVPPSAVQNLRVVETYERSLTVAWTAPQDAGPDGRAYRYDLRYAYDANASWEDFVAVTSVPPPAAAGTDESNRVFYLTPGQRHVFRMKSVDRAGNWSAESNTASGETEPLGSGPIIIVASEDGVIFSQDDGQSWHSAVFSDTRGQIGLLLADPTDPHVVYAASGLQNNMGDGLARIYRSTDRGLSWQLTSDGQLLACTSIQSMAGSADVPNLLLAGTDGYCRQTGCNDCFGQAGAVYASTDGGATWRDVSGGLPLLPANPSVHVSAHCVLIDPNDSNRWYVGMEDLDQSTANNGLFVSPDTGATWNPSAIGVAEGLPRVDVHAIAIDPEHPARSLACTDRGIFLSEDAMASWTRVSDVSERHPIVFDPRGSAAVYVGSVRSADGGRTWTGWIVPAGGLADIGIDPETGLMCAVGPGGAFISNDGVSWVNRTTLPKCTDVLVLGQHRPALADRSATEGGRP